MARIKLPDGSVREMPDGVRASEVAQAIGPRLAKAAVAARVDGEVRDLSWPLNGDIGLEILTEQNPAALAVLRHSCAHVMAGAVQRLFPGARFWVGPALEDRFYYDMDIGRSFTPDDLPRIEAEMAKIVQADYPFERAEMPKEQALQWARDGKQDFKVDILGGLESPVVSFYKDGDFTDLCRGPHIPRTGWIKAFKLLNVTGAYYQGDQSKPVLQRIYGTAFFKKDDLDTYLKNIEEAEKRDHRRLGKDLDLFSIHEEVGGGLIHWHPKGAMIRMLMENLWRDEHLKRGYSFAFTPHIASEEIYKISGHLEKYSELMYAPLDIDGRNYRVKPMNCPGHIMIFKSRLHSYREMPIRIAELGTVYRFEKSGELHGLKRVRGFTIDDAHIFCTPDQAEPEIVSTFQFAIDWAKMFGFKDYEIYLSTRPEQYVGEVADWDKAEAALKSALDKVGLPYKMDPGGGAFYGPKIDLKIKDSMNRAWQCSTIQFDFNLPRRFDISFIDHESKAQRPYMIHRALMGSLERFFAVLIEHYGGAFPLWLAPVQVSVLPIADAQHGFAREVAGELRREGYRVELNEGNERINHKIRDASLQKVPYMVVIGDREVQARKVSLRERVAGDLGAVAVPELIAKLESQIAEWR